MCRKIIFAIIIAASFSFLSGIINASYAGGTPATGACVQESSPGNIPMKTDSSGHSVPDYSNPSYKPPTWTNSMAQYGFTVGLVYCIKQTIHDAVKTYLGYLTSAAPVVAFRYAALGFVLMYFGRKLLTFGVQDVKAEAALMLIKIAIVFFLIEFSFHIYLFLVAIMDQLIYLVIKGFTVLASETCTLTPPATPPTPFPQEYDIWKEYDCIFISLMGSVTGDVSAVFASAALVIAIAVFSGTLGATMFLAGTSLLMSIIFMLTRSLLLVLNCYLMLALLMVITPFIAPALMFDSSYLTDMFKKWVGLILSTIMQPMFVIGYLSFAVFVMNVFIDGLPGTHSLPGCKPPVPAYFNADFSCNPSAGHPAQTGSTYPGSGVCPLNKLLFGDLVSPTVDDKNKALKCIKENNSTLVSEVLPGSPQGHTGGSGLAMVSKVLNGLSSGVVNILSQFTARSASLNISGFTRMHSQSSFYMLTVTFLAFALVCYLLYQLLEVIPVMASQITLNAGINLMPQKVPFEDALRQARTDMKGSKNVLGAATNGIKSLAKQMGFSG